MDRGNFQSPNGDKEYFYKKGWGRGVMSTGAIFDPQKETKVETMSIFINEDWSIATLDH